LIEFYSIFGATGQYIANELPGEFGKLKWTLRGPSPLLRPKAPQVIRANKQKVSKIKRNTRFSH